MGAGFPGSPKGTAAGGGGFGGGGAGGLGGFGFRSIPTFPTQPATGEPPDEVGQEQATSPRFDLETLIKVLTATVDPESWSSVGGAGTCEPLGGMLVIRQVAATHEKIADFLAQVRRSGGSLRLVTIEAYWLPLEAKELARAKAAAAGQQINKDTFENLAKEAKTLQGQVTCFDGQTVHIVSGRSHTVSDKANPVISAGVASYDLTLSHIHAGAMLQVTPLVSPDGKHAVGHTGKSD